MTVTIPEHIVNNDAALFGMLMLLRSIHPAPYTNVLERKDFNEMRYFAQDADGLWYAYTGKPTCDGGYWRLLGCTINEFRQITTTTLVCNPKDALFEVPHEPT